jgi:hypothetical protein
MPLWIYIAMALQATPNTSQATDLRHEALVVQDSLGELGTLVAACGESDGHGFIEGDGWNTDGMPGGRMFFVQLANGDSDLIFRSAFGLQSVTASDGIISQIRDGAQNGQYSWLVVHPSTGVVETYNLVTADSGARSVYWTSNKNLSSLLVSVAAYRADCLPSD